MEPVKGLSQLLETLRKRFDTIEKTPSSVAKGTSKANRTRTHRQTLQSIVTNRLRQLAKDDPERTEKASTIIITAALASRFGEEVLSDPEFAGLSDEIKRIFVTEPLVREKVERFLDSL